MRTQRQFLVTTFVAFIVLTLDLAAAHAQSPVKLKVLLPQPDARLLIDDVAVDGSGEERNLTVKPGPRKKVLKATAVWKPNGYTEIRRSRTVSAARAGIVDLRTPHPSIKDKIEVIYVPTPQEAVEAMCRLAKVGPDDVVYDLGCGDGRIVITAVSKFKAKRGVGVDINADLIKQCKENAITEGVAGAVEFRMGDVLEIGDLSSASVVMLYMGEDINLRLKPILQKTLKPGARVVSHSFTMGDWKPQRTESVRTERVHCDLHLWVVDAATSSLAHGSFEAIQQAVAALEQGGTRVEIQETKLVLTGGKLDDDSLANITAFSKLHELDLARIAITEKAFARIARLKALQRLRISTAPVDAGSLRHLKALRDLEALALPLTTIDDEAVQYIQILKQLKELDLTLTRIGDAGLKNLTPLQSLEVLRLDGAKVTDAGLLHLKGLANLHTLSLQQTAISDAGMVHLHDLAKLKTLNLRGTTVSVEAVRDLRKRLPGVTILHAPVF